MYNGDPKAPKLSPSIQTTYKRITLVDVILGERLTIDFDISTLDLRNKKAKAQPLKNLVIVESKSLDSECYSVNLLKKHGHVQAKACSKYALGLIQAKAVKKTSHFEETLKQIKKITK